MKNFETLVVFKSNNRVIHINMEGITHEDSLKSPENGGNCINWILGHIIASRDDVFEILGTQKLCDEEFLSLYERGSKNVSPDKAVKLKKLIETLDATLIKLEERIPDVDLTEKEEELKMLAFLSFHEAYHCGQIGILRRIIGKEGAIK
jgi:hypothetical protein